MDTYQLRWVHDDSAHSVRLKSLAVDQINGVLTSRVLFRASGDGFLVMPPRLGPVCSAQSICTYQSGRLHSAPHEVSRSWIILPLPSEASLEHLSASISGTAPCLFPSWHLRQSGIRLFVYWLIVFLLLLEHPHHEGGAVSALYCIIFPVPEGS